MLTKADKILRIQFGGLSRQEWIDGWGNEAGRRRAWVQFADRWLMTNRRWESLNSDIDYDYDYDYICESLEVKAVP